MTMNFEWSSYDSLSLFAEFRTLHQFTVAGFVHEPNVLDAWLIVSPEFGALFLLKKKLTKKKRLEARKMAKMLIWKHLRLSNWVVLRDRLVFWLRFSSLLIPF